MALASNALIKVTPGLMIWTILAFLITLFVLRRYAFGPIQKMIDERRSVVARHNPVNGAWATTSGRARLPSRCRWRTGRRR